VHDLFNKLAASITLRLGSPVALVLAIGVIGVWAITGPIFHFSDTWQLAINTGTTIVTFLMVFVIQTSQNRDSKAIHIKLDELIRAIEGARDEFITTEEATEETVKRRAQELNRLAEEEMRAGRAGDSSADDGSPKRRSRIPAKAAGHRSDS
jgi:low affinity Fe/Cu permease